MMQSSALKQVAQATILEAACGCLLTIGSFTGKHDITFHPEHKTDVDVINEFVQTQSTTSSNSWYTHAWKR